jgi:glutathione synthase/RimK-type ligase-like ATP-grasp enzyme
VPATVLIVSRRDDLHADVVEGHLTELGGRSFRLNLDAFPSEYIATLEHDGRVWSGAIRHEPSGQEVTLDDIRSVWMRKKADFRFQQPLGAQEDAFARLESEHVLFSLLHGLDCYWMNHPKAMRGAIWKGEQLMRASHMGFLTPPTLIGNDPVAARRFAQALDDDLIFKPLSSASLAADQVRDDERRVRMMPTTRVSIMRNQSAELIRIAPCTFQHHVEKSHELRVTVIGNAVFAARLDSQSDVRTTVDSRNMAAEIPYRLERLGGETARRCRAFVQSYGLTYGALDIIVTPEGREIFLENNPVGQFLYVEQLVPELEMSRHLARCLMTGRSLTAGT